MGVTHVFLRVWCDTFILIKIRGRRSVGRAPALQVDKPKRCAFMRFRRWAVSAEARIIRSSPRGPGSPQSSEQVSRRVKTFLGSQLALTRLTCRLASSRPVWVGEFGAPAGVEVGLGTYSRTAVSPRSISEAELSFCVDALNLAVYPRALRRSRLLD